jgi:hypothetical protein
MEDKLNDVQGLYSDLAQSYKNLQLEYSAVKLELETFRRESQKQGNKPPTPRYNPLGIAEWDNPEAVALYPRNEEDRVIIRGSDHVTKVMNCITL